MSTFLFALGFLTLLQVGHLHLLRQDLPPRWQRRLPWILLVLHLPLVAFFLLRLTGYSHLGVMEILRPAARGAFYFQALTLLHLSLAGLAWIAWRIRTRHPAQADASRRAFLRGAALGSLGVATASSMAGALQAYAEPESPVVELGFPDLPEGLDGLRIAHLSDLHVGPLVSADVVRQWRRTLEALRPDLVVITGDLVDSRPEELAAFTAVFHDHRAPLGTFAVLGNHDYFQDPGPIWRDLEALGIRTLENDHALVSHRGATLAVIGLQDPMALNGRFRGERFGPGPMPFEASRAIPAEAFRICLNHRPSEWPAALAAGARLTLSGHTHGGQINLFPGVNSARILGPYTGGLYGSGDRKLYVSRGLGVVALPMRINAPPELPLLVLRREGLVRRS